MNRVQRLGVGKCVRPKDVYWRAPWAVGRGGVAEQRDTERNSSTDGEAAEHAVYRDAADQQPC